MMNLVNFIGIFQLIVFTFFLIRWRIITETWAVSISAYYYLLKDKNWEFVLFTILMGVPMVFYKIYNYGDWSEVSFAASGFFLFIVGVAPFFRKKSTEFFHYLGAAGAIVFAFLGIFLEYNIWWPVVTYVGVIFGLKMFKLKNNNYTYLIEAVAFYLAISIIINTKSIL